MFRQLANDSEITSLRLMSDEVNTPRQTYRKKVLSEDTGSSPKCQSERKRYNVVNRV